MEDNYSEIKCSRCGVHLQNLAVRFDFTTGTGLCNQCYNRIKNQGLPVKEILERHLTENELKEEVRKIREKEEKENGQNK